MVMIRRIVILYTIIREYGEEWHTGGKLDKKQNWQEAKLFWWLHIRCWVPHTREVHSG